MGLLSTEGQLWSDENDPTKMAIMWRENTGAVVKDAVVLCVEKHAFHHN